MSNERKFLPGIFYGIGVGPGDPELLTVKAINAIKKTDVFIAPKTEKRSESLALSIAEPYIKTDSEIIYQTFPMIRDFADSPEVFEKNRDEILPLLNAGKNVAFLTLGDPMFFSTYIYIFNLLKNCNVKIETIPGISSFSAIAAKTGKPLAYGNDILAVIPATADPKKISDALKTADSSVLIKVYKNFDEMVNILEETGMAKNSVLVSRLGLEGEKIIEDISAHKSEKLNYLSTITARKK